MANSVENDPLHLIPVDSPGLRLFQERLDMYRFHIKGVLQLLVSHRDAPRLLEEQERRFHVYETRLNQSKVNLEGLNERFDQSYRNKKIYCDSISTRLKSIAMGKQGDWIIKSTQIHAAHTRLLGEIADASVAHENRTKDLQDATEVLGRWKMRRDTLLQTQDRFDELCLTLFGQGETPWPVHDEKREDLDAAVDALHSCEARTNSLQSALELVGEARTLLQTSLTKIDDAWIKKKTRRHGSRGLKKVNLALADV